MADQTLDTNINGAALKKRFKDNGDGLTWAELAAVELLPDARQGAMKAVSITLSATPNTVSSVPVPTGAMGFRLFPTTADVVFAVDENPAALAAYTETGANNLALGGLSTGNAATANALEVRLLAAGAATVRLASATASAVVRVGFF